MAARREDEKAAKAVQPVEKGGRYSLRGGQELWLIAQ